MSTQNNLLEGMPSKHSATKSWVLRQLSLFLEVSVHINICAVGWRDGGMEGDIGWNDQ